MTKQSNNDQGLKMFTVSLFSSEIELDDLPDSVRPNDEVHCSYHSINMKLKGGGGGC